MENVSVVDGDPSIPPLLAVSQDDQNPVKKKTRQWAAWTRKEEESFFSALRQVGKNFEKITCRVQSKNRDQVRHYYYRLVRRMNKLLAPRLSIDASNTKDTVAAMLRWWCLLEKFSCTASKLHLRPRRFKIFVETLENQLLKDRKKTRKRRPSGENNLDTHPSSISKAPANDARLSRSHAVDSHNNHKVGPIKGTSLKRSATPSVNSNKGSLPTMKAARQKRRTGVASASYKKWEKAAKAGVSLVADAAEQLERAVSEKSSSLDRGTSDSMSKEIGNTDGQKDIDSTGRTSYCLSSPELVGICSHQIREVVVQPSAKLKLQLFPIDEGTRKALEKDGHNPHLELTLSSRKKITSVLEHLNRKWGRSSIATGELLLFPYSAQQEVLASCQRWTIRDGDSSAADVYATVGSPPIFRLRYGWFPGAEAGLANAPSSACHVDNGLHSADIQNGDGTNLPDAETIHADSLKYVVSTIHVSELLVESSKNQSTSVVAAASTVDVSEPSHGNCSGECEDRLPNTSAETSLTLPGKNSIDRNIVAQQDEATLCPRNHFIFSVGEWADSLTTISVGDLLSEASKGTDTDHVNYSTGRELEQIPYSCDSFDAAIAAQASGHQLSSISTEASHALIWNAEETCDEFSFRRVPALKGDSLNPLGTSMEPCRQITQMESLGNCGYLEDLTESGPSHGLADDLRTKPKCFEEVPRYDDKHDPSNEICATDLFWPDSLGPLELDMPSSRYQTQDMILGDSISFGGLSRLIASSLDVFQNCSLFGMDKKDISGSESRGASILLDNKVGSED